MRTNFRAATLTAGALMVALLAVACAHKGAKQSPEAASVTAQTARTAVPAAKPEVKEEAPASTSTAARNVAALGASSSGRSR